MATPDLTLVSEATLPAHLDATLTSAKGYADTKKNEAITAAASDATTKANTAKTEAISDATIKYGELPEKVAGLEAEAIDLITNGSFRDGLNGWGTVGAWLPQDNGITSWARATAGADRTLRQLVTIPAYMRGRVLRLSARAWSTSTGNLVMYATPTTGIISVEHTLALEDATYTLDIPVPETQGSEPIVIDIGRSNGSVYMTAIRLEAI